MNTKPFYQIDLVYKQKVYPYFFDYQPTHSQLMEVVKENKELYFITDKEIEAFSSFPLPDISLYVSRSNQPSNKTSEGVFIKYNLITHTLNIKEEINNKPEILYSNILGNGWELYIEDYKHLNTNSPYYVVINSTQKHPVYSDTNLLIYNEPFSNIKEAIKDIKRLEKLYSI